MGIPNLQLLSFLAIQYKIKDFIETGSGHGETTGKALRIFPNVNTIELAEGLFNEVCRKYGEQADCRHGRAVDILPDILDELDGTPAVYWLDAHYSGGPTAGAEAQCDLLEELEIINSRKGNDDYIIIDDAHVFFSPAVYGQVDWLDVKQWPDIQQIFRVLEAKPRYTFILASWKCVAHGRPDGIVMPENAIVSVPIGAKPLLYDWLCGLYLEH